MKSLMLLPLLALSSTAMAGEVMVGIAGGTVIMDPLETLGTTWTVVPRVTYFFQKPIGIELETGFMTGTTQIGEDYPFVGFTPRINFIGRLWTNAKTKDRVGDDGKVIEGKRPFLQPLLVAGIGGFYKSVDDGGAFGPDFKQTDIDLVVSSGPGVLIPIGKSLHFRTDLRWLLNLGTESFRQRGDQFVNWEWTAGVGMSFGGPSDKDKDGIVDDVDKCPNVAEDKDDFEDEDGCPDLDNDSDGIPDGSDQCPNDAEDLDEFEDEDGCPDPDNDGDGILDGDDRCPVVAGHASAGGCPDEDGDGIVDRKDECVDEAGPKDAFGCPDEDGDHVPDYRDVCPEEPAAAGADPLRSDGCPTKVFITKDSIQILDKVYFDIGKATIKSKSDSLLDQIVDVLVKNPSIKKISIEGHTDNTGDPAKNKTLSQARAESVVAYLVGKEIDASRLAAKGFGQEKPITTGEEGDTTEGRTKNRRVEFHITEQEKVETLFTRKRLEVEDATIELTTLKVKHLVLPAAMTIMKTTTCDAILSIDAEGKVTTAAVTNCVALARSVSKRTMKKWIFEPVLSDDGTAIPITVKASLSYAGGKATPAIDEDSVEPVE